MKIKRVAAIVLAAAMVLSCNMTAFAVIKVDGEAITEDTKTTSTGVKITYHVEGKYNEATVQDYGNAPRYVSVSAPGEHLIINHKVTGNDGNASIVAYTEGYDEKDLQGTATVNVDKDVKENGAENAVEAYSHAVVSIEGDVTESGDGDAINAKGGSEVTVKGNVKEDGGYAIYASGDNDNTHVCVYKDVKASGTDKAILAVGNATVNVGGNVTGDNIAISASDGGTIIVEGVVSGGVFANSSSAVYIGELDGNIVLNATKTNIHYLIGLADGSKITESLIVTEDKANIIAQYGRYSIDNNKTYRYTTTADSNTLSGKSFTIASKDSNKKIKINETYSGVTIKNNSDGTVTFTIDENFKGGLQALKIIFEDIARKISKSGGSSKPLFTGTAGNPVSNGSWTQDASGVWHYGTTGTFRNTWGYIVNPYAGGQPSWFWFDANGNMLTGWQFIQGKWYYLNQSKDGTLGACQLGGVTPDGWTVDENGAWVESVPRK